MSGGVTLYGPDAGVVAARVLFETLTAHSRSITELAAGLVDVDADLASKASVASTRAALSAVGALTRTIVAEVGGAYRYDAASAATVNGWTVLAAPGGVGRFVFDDPVLTLPIRGGGLDDWPNFAAAQLACVPLGVTVRLGPGRYEMKSSRLIGNGTLAHGVHVVCAGPETEIHCDVTPTDNRDTPFCAYGESATSTTLALATNVGDKTVTLTADIGLVTGDYITLSPAAPGQGAWRLALYQVKAYNAGTKVVTLDRPIRLPQSTQNALASFPAGGAVVKIDPGRATVEFNGAHVFGRCNRYLEAHGSWETNFLGPVHLGDGTAVTAVERMASIDVPSYNCHATKLYCDGGNTTIDGLSFETAESCSYEDCVVVRCMNGEIFQDSVNCETRNSDLNNNVGPGTVFTAAQGAIGAPDNLGSDGCRVTGGSRNGNGTHGVVIEKGSSRCVVDVPSVVGNGGNGVALLGTSTTVTNKALTANVATLNTATAHSLVVGSSVVVSGMGAPFDGVWTVLSAPTATSFSFAVVAANVASTPATGTVRNWNLYDNVVTSRTQARKNTANGVEVQAVATRTRVGGVVTENNNGLLVGAGATATELDSAWSMRNNVADIVIGGEAVCNNVHAIAKAGLVNNLLTVSPGGRVRWRGGRIEAATNGAATIMNNGILDIDQADIVQVTGGIGVQTNGASAVTRIGSQARITGQGGGGFGVYAVNGTSAIAAGADVGVVFVAGGKVNFGSATVGGGGTVVVAYPELKASDVVSITRTSGAGAYTLTQSPGVGFTITGTAGDVFGWKIV